VGKKNNKEIKYDCNKNIVTKSISEECTQLTNIYAANKNRLRHIPLVNDGLLPGERRALYTMMYEKGLRYDKAYKKMSSSVGATMEYHPHGDGNIEDTICKLSQYWKNIHPLVDVQGNNGSEKGDNHAAVRYLEAKLTKYTHNCYFEHFYPDIVDMRPAYDGIHMEPEFLPAKYPHILFKQTYAMGYGVLSSIPTYNFTEVCEFVINLIDDPKYDKILYPDLPNGCEVIDDGQFDEVRKTGKGKFRMKAKVVIDEENSVIRIESMPLMMTINQLIKSEDVKGKKDSKLIKLVKEGSLVGYEDIYDKSTETSAAIEIVFKKGTDLYRNLNVLYKKGLIIKSLPILIRAINDEYELQDYTIRELLLEWLNFRRDTKRREINKGIVRKKERLHILNTLIFILQGKNGEKTVSLIKKAENNDEIQKGLMKEFGITSLQAKSISNMRMTAFSKSSLKSYKQEYDELEKEVEKLLKISKSSSKIDKLIKKELEEGIRLFGSDRKSQIVSFNNEKVIQDTDHVLVFTQYNKIKKLSSNIESIGDFEQGDRPIEVLRVNNRNSVMVFDQMGKVNKIDVADVVSTDISNKGTNLSDIIEVHGKVIKVIPVPTEEELSKIKMDNVFIVLISKKGIIKKTPFSNFVNIKRDLTAAVISNGDEIVDVKLVMGNKQLIIYTDHGKGVRITTDDIKETGRISMGVKALELKADDNVLGMNIVGKKDKYIFVVTSKGRIKKCTLDTFALMKRNVAPLVLSTLNKGEVITHITTAKGNEVFRICTTKEVTDISMKDVPELTRLAQPKKTISVPVGDHIIEVIMVGKEK
jgi:DNA gyrase subunit A